MTTANSSRSRATGASVDVVRRIHEVAREEWNSLLRADDTPFLDWDWLHAMEESHSAARKTGWSPCHVTVRDSGKLIAACPLYLKSHSMGEFVFDQGWADAAERAGLNYYPKLLVGVPFTPHTGRRFLVADGHDRRTLVEAMGRALIQLCADNKLSSINVNFCAKDESEALSGLGFLERLGYQYHWQNAGFTSFEDYLAQLKSKRRYAVKHERAALREQGITIRVIAGEAIPDELFPAMYRIYLSTIEKLYWGRQYLTKDFFEIARRDLKRYLCFICAFRGEELVAATINLQGAGVFYGRYWGAFEELKFLHFNVCYYAAIEHCIENRMARFEPGAGGEYKWLRGFDPALTRSMHFITHGGLRKAVASFLTRERREVEAWIAEGHERSQLKPPLPSNVEK
jgi:uncharacterized protein